MEREEKRREAKIRRLEAWLEPIVACAEFGAWEHLTLYRTYLAKMMKRYGLRALARHNTPGKSPEPSTENSIPPGSPS
jgi:hypothetical protein